MTKLYTFILCLMCALTMHAQCTEYVNIPDENFKAELLKHGDTITGGNISVIDTDGDGQICKSEAEAYQGTIRAINVPITDLTGLEAFINITGFNCSNTGVSTLDVSNSPALRFLGCVDNNLTTIDVSNNMALKGLLCSDNALTSLDVTGNPNLVNLNCSRNPEIKTLDLSQNVSLDRLAALNAGLTSLDVSNNKILTYINVNENDITSIDVTNNPDLVTLCFVSNNVSSLTLGDNKMALQRIGAENNQLSSLDVSAFPSLNNVKVENNLLSSLNVANGNNAGITTFSATGNPNLNCIQIDDNFTPTVWLKDVTADYSTACLVVDSFEGDFADNNGVLSWQTTNETGEIKHFLIERSIDSGAYEIIATIPSKFVLSFVANTTALTYEYTDTTSESGQMLDYKLTAVNNDDTSRVIGTVSVERTLPVVLSSFTVTVDNNDVLLSWGTSTELNNSHFNIQRSTDGTNYETVDMVYGKGTSNSEQSYDYVDYGIGSESTTVYYRLQQVDVDGLTTTFDAYSVSFTDVASASIYPSPTQQGQFVTVEGNNIDEVVVYDIIGKQIERFTYNALNKVALSTQNLRQGVYFIMINNDKTHKLVVK